MSSSASSIAVGSTGSALRNRNAKKARVVRLSAESRSVEYDVDIDAESAKGARVVVVSGTGHHRDVTDR